MKRRLCKVVFVMPLPPPFHGSGVMSNYIKQSKLINTRYNCRYVNISASRNTDEVYNFSLSLWFKKSWRLACAMVQLFSILLFHRPEVAYLAITCHGVGFLKDFLFVMLCRAFRCKIIIHQHNRGMSRCIRNWPYRILLPMAYADAKVVLLSQLLYEDVSSVVKAEQVRIIPNGIPDVEVRKVNRHNLTTTFLYISHLYKEKGIDVLLKACKKLKDERLQFQLIVIGGETCDYNKSKLSEVISTYGLSSNISYEGACYGADKEKYWEESDVFVFPTLNETFGLVLCEAMQRSLPCIASREGGIPDIIENGENGFLFNKGDVDSLHLLMRKFVTQEINIQRLRENARATYESRYKLAVFEHNISILINEVIEEK